MRMFARKKPSAGAKPIPPLLLGHSGPCYDSIALDLFAKILGRARMIRDEDADDSDRTEFEQALQLSQLYCNDALQERLNAFATGLQGYLDKKVDGMELDGLEERFMEGCRMALGTND